MVVVGSGYTGLAAARRLVRSGHHVVILEAGGVASGASSVNAGMVSPDVKRGVMVVARERGMAVAKEIWNATERRSTWSRRSPPPRESTRVAPGGDGRADRATRCHSGAADRSRLVRVRNGISDRSGRARSDRRGGGERSFRSRHHRAGRRWTAPGSLRLRASRGGGGGAPCSASTPRRSKSSPPARICWSALPSERSKRRRCWLPPTGSPVTWSQGCDAG